MYEFDAILGEEPRDRRDSGCSGFEAGGDTVPGDPAEGQDGNRSIGGDSCEGREPESGCPGLGSRREDRGEEGPIAIRGAGQLHRVVCASSDEHSRAGRPADFARAHRSSRQMNSVGLESKRGLQAPVHDEYGMCLSCPGAERRARRHNGLGIERFALPNANLNRRQSRRKELVDTMLDPRVGSDGFEIQDEVHTPERRAPKWQVHAPNIVLSACARQALLRFSRRAVD